MKGSKRLHGTTVFENHKKVSFNIASEPSNVEILSGQKLIKVPKLAAKRCYKVTFKRTKIGGIYQNRKEKQKLVTGSIVL